MSSFKNLDNDSKDEVNFDRSENPFPSKATQQNLKSYDQSSPRSFPSARTEPLDRFSRNETKRATTSFKSRSSSEDDSKGIDDLRSFDSKRYTEKTKDGEYEGGAWRPENLQASRSKEEIKNKGIDYSQEPMERDYRMNYQRSERPFRYQEQVSGNDYRNQDQPQTQRWREDGYRPTREYNPSNPSRTTKTVYQREATPLNHWNDFNQENKKLQGNESNSHLSQHVDESHIQVVYYHREIRFQTVDENEQGDGEGSHQPEKRKKASEGKMSGLSHGSTKETNGKDHKSIH